MFSLSGLHTGFFVRGEHLGDLFKHFDMWGVGGGGGVRHA